MEKTGNHLRDEEAQDTLERHKDMNKVKPRKDLSVQLVPPDGGWGWVIIVAGFGTLIFGSLPLCTFGIIFSPMLMNFNVSSAKVAWIFNVHSFVWNTTALFAGPLVEAFGWRKVAIGGGILNSVSMMLSGVSPSPDFLFFSFSFLGGMGGSTALIVSLIVVSRYFEKRRGLALGITTLGMCASTFIGPLVANLLITHYGYMGASFIYGAIILNQCVSASLFQPVKWHMKKVIQEPDEKELLTDYRKPFQMNRVQEIQNRKMSLLSAISSISLGQSSIADTQSGIFSEVAKKEEISNGKRKYLLADLIKDILQSTYDNLKTLRYTRVIIISIASGFMLLGYINFQMWIPFVVSNYGFSLQLAAWCVSVSSIANSIGRICISSLADRKIFSVKLGYMFGMLSIGIFIIAFTMVRDITLMMVFASCWGLSVGAVMALHPTVMIEVMGIDMFPAVYGVSSLSIAIIFIAVGPIVGIIRDVTSSYQYALWVIGGLEILGFGLWTLISVATKYDLKREAPKAEQNTESYL